MDNKVKTPVYRSFRMVVAEHPCTYQKHPCTHHYPCLITLHPNKILCMDMSGPAIPSFASPSSGERTGVTLLAIMNERIVQEGANDAYVCKREYQCLSTTHLPASVRLDIYPTMYLLIYTRSKRWGDDTAHLVTARAGGDAHHRRLGHHSSEPSHSTA